MISSTYTADINGALAYDPSIAGNIVSGLAGQMDPGTEAYAAAYELQQDAQLLQGNDISNPTVVDVRAVYQFGASVGPQVAQAPDTANLETIVNLRQHLWLPTVLRRRRRLDSGERCKRKNWGAMRIKPFWLVGNEENDDESSWNCRVWGDVDVVRRRGGADTEHAVAGVSVLHN